MCKNFSMIGMNINSRVLEQFKRALLPGMAKTDPHGIGCMEYSEKGVHVERWDNPRDAFKHRRVLSKEDHAALQAYPMLRVEEVYNTTGTKGKAPYAMAMHSRFATTPRGMKNLHPFKHGDTYLQHNGIVDTTDLILKTSTCDSEGILNAYVDNRVNEKLDNLRGMIDKLHGYYACIVFSKDKAGMPIVDVFKSSAAKLYLCYISSVKAWVFITETSILSSACRAMGWKHGKFYSVPAGVLIRHDAATGEVIEYKAFNEASPRYQQYSSKYTAVHEIEKDKALMQGTLIDESWTSKNATDEDWADVQDNALYASDVQPLHRSK